MGRVVESGEKSPAEMQQGRKKEKSQIGRASSSSFVGLVDQPLIDVFLAAAAKKLHFHKSSHEEWVHWVAGSRGPNTLNALDLV